MKNSEEQPVFTSRTEAKRYIVELLPLQDAMILTITPPPEEATGHPFAADVAGPMSLIWLDMSKRPVPRDLARVHANPSTPILPPVGLTYGHRYMTYLLLEMT